MKIRAPSIIIMAITLAALTSALNRGVSCQNQDLLDYRILRFPRRAYSTCKRSSVFLLAGFPIMAKSAIWTKRNPENPANPDSG